jgi:glycosyltransferase involved in cell wall biosynthesis
LTAKGRAVECAGFKFIVNAVKALRVVAVIPARGGVSGASLAVVHMLLGVVSRFRRVEVVVVTSPEALRFPAVRRLRGRGASIALPRISALPGPLYWLGLMAALLPLLRHGRFDVVHFSTPKALVLMYPAARIVARRVVLSLEGFPPYELEGVKGFRRVLGMFTWYAALRWADAVAACSEWLRQACVRSVGFGEKLSTVHNPVDFERFVHTHAKASAEHGVRLAVVARLDHVKGVDIALRALAALRDRRFSDVRLVVVGDGPEAGRLRDIAVELGVDGLVEFAGFRHDVERYIASSDIVLVPSRYEPFGMVAAEAAAAGKPVVASRVGGLREIVVDGETGLLFNPDDHNDLAEKIIALIEDNRRAAEMGLKGRARAERLFSPLKVAEKLAKTYLGALK